MGKLLLISNESYGSLEYLIEGLLKNDIKHKQLNLSLFPQDVYSSIKMDNEGHLIAYGNEEFNMDDVKVIFFQGYGSNKRADENTTSSFLNFIRTESDEYIKGLFSLVHPHWINDPEYSLRTENKIYQLEMASRIGLNIPKTLITNNPKDAKEFFEHHSKNVVVKPLKTNLINIGHEKQVMFTSLVTNEDFDSVKCSPCFFQEYVDKELELRIIVIGDKALSLAIHSQDSEKTRVDWRRDVWNLKITEYTLDEEVKKKCVLLTKQLGLEYGAIDMIFSKKGEYYFLEINPTGEWAWLEKKSGAPIRKVLIDRISEFI